MGDRSSARVFRRPSDARDGPVSAQRLGRCAQDPTVAMKRSTDRLLAKQVTELDLATDDRCRGDDADSRLLARSTQTSIDRSEDSDDHLPGSSDPR